MQLCDPQKFQGLTQKIDNFTSKKLIWKLRDVNNMYDTRLYSTVSILL